MASATLRALAIQAESYRSVPRVLAVSGVDDQDHRIAAFLLMPDAFHLLQVTPASLRVKHTALDRVCDWIRANLHLPLTLTDIERHSGVTGRMLQISFQKRYGTSPMAWLREQRLQAARTMLDRSHDTGEQAALAAIAAARGFSLPEAPDPEVMKDVDMAAVPEWQRRSLQRLRARASTNFQSFAYLEGLLLAAERRFPAALAAFDRAATVQVSQRPSLLMQRGDVLLKLRRPAEAAETFAAALAIDPINPEARFGLARAALASGDPARARTEAIAAIAGRPRFPRAHLVAGVASWRIADLAAAERHLREAVAQYPDYPAAHRLLATYLARVSRDPAAAWEHRLRAAEARREVTRRRTMGVRPTPRPAPVDPLLNPPWLATPHAGARLDTARCVVVVSGLPRSGTSMMMQMLAAGGVPLLADDIRLADENNPRGYLEFEPAKRVMHDQSWLATATGKAVKIVVPLVQHLPRTADAPPYLVVMMRRPIAEVVQSQRTMLARDGRSGATIPDESLAAVFERQLTVSRTMLAHLEAQGRCRTLDLAYGDVLADPQAAAERLRNFLQLPGFDGAAAAAQVDGQLHRTRAAPT